MKERYSMAKQWVLRAGALLRDATRQPFDFSAKTGHQDIVTAFDKEVERYFRTNIGTFFPDDHIVGEEYASSEGAAAEVTWYIDPIDGTTNFVNLRKHFAISVGCYRNQIPQFSFIYDVIGGDLYSAFAGEGAFKNDRKLGQDPSATELGKMILSTPNVQDAFWRNYPWQASMLKLADQVRAVRSLGSVALELCAVAEGTVDIFVAMRSAPWDHNGARLILLESGCRICALGMEELPTDREVPIFACRNEAVFEQLKADCGFTR